MKTAQPKDVYKTQYLSPLGPITLSYTNKALVGLWFSSPDQNLPVATEATSHPILKQVIQWLDLYFSGQNPSFLPPLEYTTTPFRTRVCQIMLTIPYGQTMTYGQIAKIIAKEKGLDKMSAQAVGGAVGHNPIAIMIPCHRVIGTNGKLTGYAGGLERKTKLLKLEKTL